MCVSAAVQQIPGKGHGIVAAHDNVTEKSLLGSYGGDAGACVRQSARVSVSCYLSFTRSALVVAWFDTDAAVFHVADHGDTTVEINVGQSFANSLEKRYEHSPARHLDCH